LPPPRGYTAVDLRKLPHVRLVRESLTISHHFASFCEKGLFQYLSVDLEVEAFHPGMIISIKITWDNSNDPSAHVDNAKIAMLSRE
jgi:hypothetical protein